MAVLHFKEKKQGNFERKDLETLHKNCDQSFASIIPSINLRPQKTYIAAFKALFGFCSYCYLLF